MSEPTAEEARKLVEAFATEAKEKLDELGTVHKFEMDGECADKDGNETKAFIVDTDRKGVLSMFLSHGQPITLSAGGDMVTDQEKLAAYFGFMSNIDITKDENLTAIGWNALSKGRELVSTFFTLRLASDTFSA